MLNSTTEQQQDGRRKQSIFFASYGVWSEESVMSSIRDLSPIVSSVLEAAWCGQVGTLEELLKMEENLENINCRDSKGRTPLHLAAACGHAGGFASHVYIKYDSKSIKILKFVHLNGIFRCGRVVTTKRYV